MTIDTAWKELWRRLHELRDAVLRLRLATDDAPLTGRVLLVDVLADDVAELAGLVEEALAAVGEEPEPGREPRALASCHERISAASRRYFDEIATYERYVDLLDLGRSRGGGWQAWAENTKDTLESCRLPFQDAGDAIVFCLQELADRSELALKPTTS